MASTVVIGCTGLVGNEVLKTLIASEDFPSLHTISRRAPKQTSPKLSSDIEADTAKWAAALQSLKPPPSAVISALGTSSAQAGSVAAQWRIDHDLNVELARAAKALGVETFVFVSSAGTRGFPSNRVPYSKMKIGVEDEVMGLGFENAVIMRPGMILGEREAVHGTGNAVLGGVLNGAINGMGKVSKGLKDMLGQEAEVIGRAAVYAARVAAEGKAPKNPWILDGADIVRYGRDEWKE